MCYSRDCRYENYWGECEKPKHKPCPKAPAEDEPDSNEKEDDDDDEN